MFLSLVIQCQCNQQYTNQWVCHQEYYACIIIHSNNTINLYLVNYPYTAGAGKYPNKLIIVVVLDAANVRNLLGTDTIIVPVNGGTNAPPKNNKPHTYNATTQKLVTYGTPTEHIVPTTQ